MKNTIHKYHKHISLLSILLVATVATYLLWPYVAFFNDREQLELLIDSTGVWAPVVYILFQIIQVVIAPIPGSIISLVGGYIFGAFLGVTYNLIGSFLGFYLVFFIAKRYGRPLAKFFIKKDKLKKYEEIMQNQGKVFLFIAFLIPVIPDAAAGYVAGLSKLSISTLMIMVMIARLPGLVLLNLVGGQSANSNYSTVIILVIILAVSLIAIYSYYLYKFKNTK